MDIVMNHELIHDVEIKHELVVRARVHGIVGMSPPTAVEVTRLSQHRIGSACIYT